MTKYKIALVSAFPPSGGSLNEYGFHMAREMAKRKDVSEVVVLADKMEVEVPEPDHGKKIRVVRCWKFNTVSTAFDIVKTLKAEGIDGVIYNVQTASFGDREIPAALGLATPVLSRIAGIKSGVLTHNLIEAIDLENTILKGNFLRQKLVQVGAWFVSYAMTRANYLTTTLDIYADILKQRFPRADITMVPHGTFERDTVELAPFDERPKNIVTMGKFGTYKKLGTLIEAFLELQKEDKELKLIIGGTDHPNTPGYMADLEEQYKENKAIVFHGYVAEEDVAQFFASSRLSVFDYTATTGSSGVLHQCASYGSVPVFPHIGDFVELCEREGLRGYHYQPANAASMAGAMQEALENIDQSAEFGRTNLEAANEISLAQVMDFHINKLCHGDKAAQQVFEANQANA